MQTRIGPGAGGGRRAMNRQQQTTASGIAYTVHGEGPPVVLLPPAATRADVWLAHQVPALAAFGRAVVALETRGSPPSIAPSGPYAMADLVADAAAVITDLGAGPVPVVGASLGAMVAQELCLARPDLVDRVALLGTRARIDRFREVAARAVAERIAGGPPSVAEAEFEAVALMGMLFSARTLDDDRLAGDWLEVFRAFPLRGPGLAAQYALAAVYGLPDRTAALAAVRTSCLVVAFGDDRVTPPAAGRAVAGAIPGARLVEAPGCGHFGFLERPDLVNAALIGFLAR